MRLSELTTGEKGVIVKVLGHGGFRKRIVEMGFIKGKTVEVLLNAPLKDPIKYKVLGYEISLRRQEAEMIEVVSEEEAKKQAGETIYHEGLPEDVSVKEEDMKRLAVNAVPLMLPWSGIRTRARLLFSIWLPVPMSMSEIIVV